MSHGVTNTTKDGLVKGMRHKQDVCRKSGSSLFKVSRWSTEGLSMYNVNIFRVCELAADSELHSESMTQ